MRHAPQGNPLFKFCDKRLRLVIENAPRRNGIHADARGSPVGCQVASEAKQARLNYGVGNGFNRLLLLGETSLTIQPLVGSDYGEVRTNVENHAFALSCHLRAEYAAA